MKANSLNWMRLNPLISRTVHLDFVRHGRRIIMSSYHLLHLLVRTDEIYLTGMKIITQIRKHFS